MSDDRRWVNPTTRRWYCARLDTDLLGDAVALVSWGSLDSRRGNGKTVVVTGCGSDWLDALGRRRVRRKYQAVSGITKSSAG